MNKNFLKMDVKDILKTDISIKNILIMVCIGLGVVFYGYFGLYPKYKEYIDTTKKLKSAQSKLASYQDEIIQMPRLKDKLSILNSELNIKKNKLSHDMEDGLFLIGLNKKMEEHNITLLNYEIEEAKNYNSFYAVPTTITLRGNYRDVRDLMSYLEQQENTTQVLDFNMKEYIDKDNTQFVNNSINLTQDRTVYWIQDESKYHLNKDCSLISKEQPLLEGKLLDNSKENICNPCLLNESINNIQSNPQLKSTGIVESKFKFIMYSKENPTMHLDTVKPWSWRVGKFNPFTLN